MWSRSAEDDAQEERRVADYTSVDRAQLHRQLLAAQLRLHRRHAEAVRGAQGRRGRRQRDHRAARRRSSGRSRAAPSCRSRRRRSSASAPAAASPTSCRICAAAIPKELAQVLRGLVVAANQEPQLSRVFTHLLGTNPSIYLDIDRNKVADPRRAAERRVPGAAGLARRLLRQRHQPVRPDLAGPGPGRGGGPRERSTTSIASTCATPTARWCRCAASSRCASSSARRR